MSQQGVSVSQDESTSRFSSLVPGLISLQPMAKSLRTMHLALAFVFSCSPPLAVAALSYPNSDIQARTLIHRRSPRSSNRFDRRRPVSPATPQESIGPERPI